MDTQEITQELDWMTRGGMNRAWAFDDAGYLVRWMAMGLPVVAGVKPVITDNCPVRGGGWFTVAANGIEYRVSYDFYDFSNPNALIVPSTERVF